MQRIHCYFITPTPSQPRYHKRIRACLEQGHPVTVFTFRRGLYEINELPPDVSVIDLGFLRGGRYLSRILPLCRAALRVRSALRSAPDNGILYCFGLDCALLGLVCRQKPLRFVYEVGDIIYLLAGQSRIVRSVMTALDRLVTRSVDLLVLTSEGFLPHYRRLNPLCPLSIVENRIARELAAVSRPAGRVMSRPIRIGFVGLVYYLECLQGLIDFVASHEGYEAHVFGDGADTLLIREAADRYPGRVFFHGPFRNPADLPAIYKRIDFNFVVYDPDDENVRVLMPNKYYESLFFVVPLIVADGTLLAERVRSRAVGYGIDAHRIPMELDRIFRDLTEERYAALCASACAVPLEELIDDSYRLMADLPGGAR
jgi:succinoglycan biosynthesis protein ExoL